MKMKIINIVIALFISIFLFAVYGSGGGTSGRAPTPHPKPAASVQTGGYFLALELPGDTKRSIRDRQVAIYNYLSSVHKLTYTDYDDSDHPYENLHSTLVELTTKEDPRKDPNFNKAMAKIVQKAVSFSLKNAVGKATLHAQGSAGKDIGYIVFNLGKSSEATNFVKLIRNVFDEYGVVYKSERKDFLDIGHISVAKYNGEKGPKKYMEDRFGKDGDHEIEPPDCGGFRVNSFVIKRSNYPNKPRRYDNVGDPYVF